MRARILLLKGDRVKAFEETGYLPMHAPRYAGAGGATDFLYAASARFRHRYQAPQKIRENMGTRTRRSGKPN
jgi:hypothetical protein